MVKTVMIDWNPFEMRPLLKGNAVVPAKIRTFIQARETSKRLPGKVYKEIDGESILNHTIRSARESKFGRDVVVVSPHSLKMTPGTENFVFRGDENDVLSRYHAALKEYPCDYVVRLTADCPLLDSHLIDFVISNSIGYDYGSDVLVCTFPDGQDIEVISSETLEKLNSEVLDDYDREHVTTFIRNKLEVQRGMSLVDVQSTQDYSAIKISVDTEEDYNFVKCVSKDIARVR